VGRFDDGHWEGFALGRDEGKQLGLVEGDWVGGSEVGFNDGKVVGKSDEGACDGSTVGVHDGENDGF